MMTTKQSRSVVALLAFILPTFGCGGGSHPSSSTTDMAPSLTGPTPPVLPRAADDHPALWQIRNNGGPTQSAPRVYTVVWPGSELLGQKVEQFISWMVTSDYFTGTLAEYGVGAGQSMGLIVLPDAAPPKLLDADLRTLVTQLLASGQVDPRGDANTQIVFIVPPTTIVTAGSMSSCSYFAGYHDSPSTSLPIVAYDVIADCDSSSTELDTITKVISHEVAEAATDPLPNSGWAAEPPVSQEISDLCNFNENLPIDVPGDPPIRYWVQRQYSNIAAQANDQDPCLPLPWARPFWSAALYPREQTISVSTTPQTLQAWIEPFAYGDVGIIRWDALFTDGSMHAEPSSGIAQAGDTIPIRITLDKPSKATVYEIDIESQSAKAGSSWWFAYVVVK
jgi:hypothetical protein